MCYVNICMLLKGNSRYGGNKLIQPCHIAQQKCIHTMHTQLTPNPHPLPHQYASTLATHTHTHTRTHTHTHCQTHPHQTHPPTPTPTPTNTHTPCQQRRVLQKHKRFVPERLLAVIQRACVVRALVVLQLYVGVAGPCPIVGWQVLAF